MAPELRTLVEWARELREASGEPWPSDETVKKWPILHADFPPIVRRAGNVRLYSRAQLGAWLKSHPDVGKGRFRHRRKAD